MAKFPESAQNGCVYGAIPFPGYTLGVWENGRTRAGTAYAEKKFHFFFPKQEYILTPDVIVAGEGDPGPGPECPGRVVVEEEKKIGGTLYHGPKRYYPKNGWVRIRPVANPGYRFVRWETAKDVTGAVLGMRGTRIPKVVNGLEEEEIAIRMENDTIITAVFRYNGLLVVEGGGTFCLGTEADDLLPSVGYPATKLVRPTEDEVAAEIPFNNVFVFNGHGWKNEMCIDYGKDVFFDSADVLSANGTNPYKLVFFNMCGSGIGNCGKTWNFALTSTAFVGWDAKVSNLKANSFDARYWKLMKEGSYSKAAVIKVIFDMKIDMTNPWVPHPVYEGNVQLVE